MYDYLIIGGALLVVVILFVYLYSKDAEVSKKFFLYERSIEDLNKKVFDLEKALKKKDSSNELKKEIKEYVDSIIEENLEKISEFVLLQRDENRASFEKFKSEIIEKIERVNERVKNINLIPEEFHSNEKSIIELYEKGLSVSEIARRLRIGIGEVELVLKIEGIK